MQTGRSKELVAGSSAEPGGRATPMPEHRQTQLQRDRQGHWKHKEGKNKTQELPRNLQRPSHGTFKR